VIELSNGREKEGRRGKGREREGNVGGGGTRLP